MITSSLVCSSLAGPEMKNRYNMAKYGRVVKELSISSTLSTIKPKLKTLKCRKGQGLQKIDTERVRRGSFLTLTVADHA